MPCPYPDYWITTNHPCPITDGSTIPNDVIGIQFQLLWQQQKALQHIARG